MNTKIPKFLLEMSSRLRTQNNLCTADPLFTVEERKWDVIDISMQDPEGYVVYDQEDCEIGGVFEIGEFDASSLRKGEQAWPVRFRWAYIAGFFTRKGAEHYIRINGHNLAPTRIYVDSMFRCREMTELRNWILSLSAHD